MKIALCLYGVLGGRGGRDGGGGVLHPGYGHSFYQHSLFERFDVDVFIHSWASEHEDLIRSTYAAKACVIEPQELFEGITIANYGFKGFDDLFAEDSNRIVLEAQRGLGKNDQEIMDFYQDMVFRTNSRWLSGKKSVDLKRAYELAHGFQYDFVITTRFDIGLTRDIDFSVLDANTLYCSYRHGRVDFDRAFYDLIFFGGSSVIDQLLQLYDHIFELPIRPPWASRRFADALGLQHRHYLTDCQDYILLRSHPELIQEGVV